MPLNSIPPTTTLSALATKQACAKEVGVSCDVGFWGGIVPGNEGELRGLWEAGVKGFKCFLIESGVEVGPVEQCKRVDKLNESLGVSVCRGTGYHQSMRRVKSMFSVGPCPLTRVSRAPTL